MLKLKKAMLFFSVIFILSFLTSCNETEEKITAEIIKNGSSDEIRETQENVKSITYTIIPTFGVFGEMITYRITVFSDGNVLHEQENDLGEILSAEETQLSDTIVLELIDLLHKENFFDLADDLSTDSYDGSWHYIEVVTDNNIYKKGGLNPDNENFKNCNKAISSHIKH